jgi:hypothetical protein
MGKRDHSVDFAHLAPDTKSDEGRTLDALLRKAGSMERVQQQVLQCLPKNLAPHVRVSAFKSGQLTLMVESPVWKTKLRLAQNELIACCRAAGFEIEEIKVRTEVRPQPKPVPPSRLVITPAAEAAFAAAAEAGEEAHAEMDPEAEPPQST